MPKQIPKKNELSVKEQAAIETTTQENALYIAHQLKGLNAEPVDLTDVEAVEKRAMDYFMDCSVTGTRVTPPGLALWLGISTTDLTEWLNGYGPEEQKKSAARIYQFLQAAYADIAMAGKMNSQVAIFFGKNWFAYRENPTVEAAQTIERKKSLDELEKEAEALPDIEIIETQGKGKR